MVSETLEPGSSVSIVARRHDVNTNQLFKWRRELLPKAVPAVVEASTMVPVEIVPERPRRRRRWIARAHRDRVRRRAGKPARRGGSSGSSPGHRAAAMIGLVPGTRVWLAAGVTELRKGFDSLAAQAADGVWARTRSRVICFRGRRGDLIKLLWWMATGCVCSPSGWSEGASSGREPSKAWRC